MLLFLNKPRKLLIIFETLIGNSIWKTIRARAVVPNQRERTNLILSPITSNSTQTGRTNATFLFSAGEFSTLGLAIFLSRAIELENLTIGQGPELKTLFLDDPIRELDYLREDALAYLLCDIALERQVVVSTSNVDFANRLILSSRPIWEKYDNSCGVLYLQKHGKYNNVRFFQPQKWISEQGIYMPERRIG